VFLGEQPGLQSLLQLSFPSCIPTDLTGPLQMPPACEC
jgi:hypothetical protein